MSLIASCNQATNWDERLAAFQMFQRAITRVSANRFPGRGSLAEKVLEDIEPKSRALELLIEIHNHKKIQRKRVSSAFKTILGFPSWQRALTDNDTVRETLPLDLKAILLSTSCEKEEVKSALLPDDDVPMDVSLACSHVPSTTEMAVEQHLSSDQVDKMDVSIAQEIAPFIATSSKTMLAEDLLDKGIQDMSKLSFTACERISAGVAFDTFSHGVTELLRSAPDHYVDVIEGLEPKVGILEFMVDMHQRNKQKRNAVRSLLCRLLDLHAWEAVTESDENLFERVSHASQYWGLPDHSVAPAVPIKCPCVPSREAASSKVPVSHSTTKLEKYTALLGKRSGGSWYSRAIASIGAFRRH
jgi:hypothetical protein